MYAVGRFGVKGKRRRSSNCGDKIALPSSQYLCLRSSTLSVFRHLGFPIWLLSLPWVGRVKGSAGEGAIVGIK